MHVDEIGYIMTLKYRFALHISGVLISPMCGIVPENFSERRIVVRMTLNALFVIFRS